MRQLYKTNLKNTVMDANNNNSQDHNDNELNLENTDILNENCINRREKQKSMSKEHKKRSYRKFAGIHHDSFIRIRLLLY